MKTARVPVLYQVRISREMAERLQRVAQYLGLRQADVARVILAKGLAEYVTSGMLISNQQEEDDGSG